MKNEAFKHFISWLLIASPLWWASGCISEIIKPNDSGENEIEVVTEGDSVYTFLQWTSDEWGAITGTSGWVKYKDPYFGWTTSHLQKPVTIPAYRIQRVSNGESVSRGSAILTLITTVSLMVICYAIFHFMFTRRLF